LLLFLLAKPTTFFAKQTIFRFRRDIVFDVPVNQMPGIFCPLNALIPSLLRFVSCLHADASQLPDVREKRKKEVEGRAAAANVRREHSRQIQHQLQTPKF